MTPLLVSLSDIYLTGGTLILALVLARAFSICLELAETHQELGQLKKGVSGGNRTRLEVEQLEARIGELEGELEVKERDIGEFFFVSLVRFAPKIQMGMNERRGKKGSISKERVED